MIGSMGGEEGRFISSYRSQRRMKSLNEKIFKNKRKKVVRIIPTKAIRSMALTSFLPPTILTPTKKIDSSLQKIKARRRNFFICCFMMFTDKHNTKYGVMFVRMK
ncbi:CLUMA_CG006176, isoform A [Clunio marinus]|uniref:CLUMA_CG006176, isoform A n=1 Tax=Clunio marinus TaxID=568069 RepID=A0A1J1HWY0_9DIPT|nr:CLUMA_CG006176, isoform A [Clunio marinus]